MIKTFGVPHRIVSDMGTSFTSEKFKAFVDEIQAIHHLTAVSMPHRNGEVERYNQAILSSLVTMGADCDGDRWDEQSG
jgi:transposase InsO family protein